MDNALARLRHFIKDHHNLEEFRTLCFDLGVRFNVLGGEGLDAKARELLLHLRCQRRFDDRLKVLENARTEPFRQAGFGSRPADLELLYAALPAFSGSDLSATEVAGADVSSAQEATARNRRISHALVEKVRAIWIHDVLEKSLHNMARIELGLAKLPDAVERPWAMVMERPGEEEKPLLQELAQTPLTLNIIALAYQGRGLYELASGTLEKRHRHLFETYVQRMFDTKLEQHRQASYVKLHHRGNSYFREKERPTRS